MGKELVAIIVIIAMLCSAACARMPQIGDDVYIYSGYFSYTCEGTITDIGNGFICLHEFKPRDSGGRDVCIGIGSIMMLSWI